MPCSLANRFDVSKDRIAITFRVKQSSLLSLFTLTVKKATVITQNVRSSQPYVALSHPRRL